VARLIICNFQELADWLDKESRKHFDGLQGLEADGLGFREIGSGAFRTVYRIVGTPYVAKVGHGGQMGNRTCWNAYQQLKPHEKRWIAKPKAISKRGKILISTFHKRRRITLAHARVLYRNINPIYCWDMHRANATLNQNGWPVLIDEQPCGKWKKVLKQYRKTTRGSVEEIRVRTRKPFRSNWW